jgi:Mg/Co/Ni transporter MgtE
MTDVKKFIQQYLKINKNIEENKIILEINNIKIKLRPYKNLYSSAEREYKKIINDINIYLIRNIQYENESIQNEENEENESIQNEENNLLKKILEQKKIHNFIKLYVLKKYYKKIDSVNLSKKVEIKKLSAVNSSVKPQILFNSKIVELTNNIEKKKKIILQKNLKIKEIEEKNTELELNLSKITKYNDEQKLKFEKLIDEQKCDKEFYEKENKIFSETKVDLLKQIELINENIKEQKEEILRINEQLRFNRDELSKKNQEILDMKQYIQQKEIDQVNMIQNIQQKEEEIQYLRQQEQQTTLNIEQLTTNITLRTIEVLENIKKKEEELLSLKENIKIKEEELLSLRKDIDIKKKELDEKDILICNELENNKKKLKNLNDQLSKNKKVKLSILKQLRNVEKKNKKLKDENKKLKEKIDNYDQIIKERGLTINKLEKKIRSWKLEIEKKKEEISREKKQNELLNLEILRKEEDIINLQKINSKLEDKNKENEKIFLENIQKFLREIGSDDDDNLEDQKLENFISLLETFSTKYKDLEKKIKSLIKNIEEKDIVINDQECNIEELRILLEKNNEPKLIEDFKENLDAIQNPIERKYSLNSKYQSIHYLLLLGNFNENFSPNNDEFSKLCEKKITQEDSKIPKKIIEKANNIGYKLGSPDWNGVKVIISENENGDNILIDKNNKLYYSFFLPNGIEIILFNDENTYPVYNFLYNTYKTYLAAYNFSLKYKSRIKAIDFPNTQEYEYVRLNINRNTSDFKPPESPDLEHIYKVAYSYGYIYGTKKYGILDVEPILEGEFKLEKHCGFRLHNGITVLFFEDYTIKYVCPDNYIWMNYKDLYNSKFKLLYKVLKKTRNMIEMVNQIEKKTISFFSSGTKNIVSSVLSLPYALYNLLGKKSTSIKQDDSDSSEEEDDDNYYKEQEFCENEEYKESWSFKNRKRSFENSLFWIDYRRKEREYCNSKEKEEKYKNMTTEEIKNKVKDLSHEEKMKFFKYLSHEQLVKYLRNMTNEDIKDILQKFSYEGKINFFNYLTHEQQIEYFKNMTEEEIKNTLKDLSYVQQKYFFNYLNLEQIKKYFENVSDQDIECILNDISYIELKIFLNYLSEERYLKYKKELTNRDKEYCDDQEIRKYRRGLTNKQINEALTNLSFDQKRDFIYDLTIEQLREFYKDKDFLWIKQRLDNFKLNSRKNTIKIISLPQRYAYEKTLTEEEKKILREDMTKEDIEETLKDFSLEDKKRYLSTLTFMQRYVYEENFDEKIKKFLRDDMNIEEIQNTLKWLSSKKNSKRYLSTLTPEKNCQIEELLGKQSSDSDDFGEFDF